MSNLPITIVQLDSLRWNVLTPLKNARLSLKEDFLDKIVDFQMEKTAIAVFIEPQGHIVSVCLPVTVSQLLFHVKQCVQNTDDCVVWAGVQRIEDTESNQRQWKLLGSDLPLPDYVVMLEE